MPYLLPYPAGAETCNPPRLAAGRAGGSADYRDPRPSGRGAIALPPCGLSLSGRPHGGVYIISSARLRLVPGLHSPAGLRPRCSARDYRNPRPSGRGAPHLLAFSRQRERSRKRGVYIISSASSRLRRDSFRAAIPPRPHGRGILAEIMMMRAGGYNWDSRSARSASSSPISMVFNSDSRAAASSAEPGAGCGGGIGTPPRYVPGGSVAAYQALIPIIRSTAMMIISQRIFILR